MRLAERALEVIIIAAIAANAAGVGLFFWLRPRAGLYQPGERLPPPSGYLVDGSFLPTSLRSRCYLLRITSEGCPYCVLDKPIYDQLSAKARDAGCEDVEISPKTGLMPPRAHARQLQYIALSLARVLNPFVTPQTILLDKRGAVSWYRTGAMDEASLNGAIAALRRLR